jgi:pyruvate,orthophosphate dikinase
MLGLRGDRLGIVMPEITEMQVRAILEAAMHVKRDGVDVHPEIMIPLAGHVNDSSFKEIVDRIAAEVFAEAGTTVDFKYGTMIECRARRSPPTSWRRWPSSSPSAPTT